MPMVLNKNQIREAIAAGKLVFEPGLDGFQLQPNSIDLRVGWSFYVPQTWEMTQDGRVALRADYFDTEANKEYFKLVKLKPGQYFEVLSHEFILISTLEKITLVGGDLSCALHARSSLLRRGLTIGGVIVDTFYIGQLTIPIINNANHTVRLYPGERIIQLVVHQSPTALEKAEAEKHGLTDGKYVRSTPYGLEARSDSIDEIGLIKTGKIDELKQKFVL